jgi:glucokinase-like ROK family protein
VVVDQAFLRETNLSALLHTLCNNTPLSRAQLANLIGLNKSTVSSLVEELLARGLIHAIGLNPGSAGRPGILLEINPQAGAVIGVELGVDFISVVVTDFLGQIIWRRFKRVDPMGATESIISQALALSNDACAFCHEKEMRLLGLGLSIPGTVDVTQGVLIYAPNLNWRNVPLGEIFSKATGLKVIVENDANAAAIGEHLFGVARQSKDFIFVFAGVGIGGGLFLNDHLYRGKEGQAGEIGHAPIMAEPLQYLCHCGNRGCWETYANQSSLIQRMQMHMDGKKNNLARQLMEEQNAPLSVDLIKQAADLGDKDARESFAGVGEAMGLGIANLVNIFNPDKVILGGPLSIGGKYLLPAINENVAKHSMPGLYPQVQILLSAFCADASVIGASALVIDSLMDKPAQVERW